MRRYFKLDDLESFLQDSERAAARDEEEDAEEHLGAGMDADCCSACTACGVCVCCALQNASEHKARKLGCC